MRIAIISSLQGGLGHYCAHLATPLSKYCSLKFITYPQMDLSGISVKQLTDSFVAQYIKWPRFDVDDTNPTSILGIVDYLQGKETDIVNMHIGTTVKRRINYFTTLVLYAKKTTKLKFVYTLHDVMPFDEDKRMTRLLQVFYSLADAFTVGNESEKQKLMKNFDIPASKIEVIPHGIYNLFDRDLYNKQFARGYLGLPNDKKIILFFGFLREYKGFDYLIKAVKILSKKYSNFLVYVASGLKYTPKDLVETDLRLIKKLGVEDYFSLNLNYLNTLDIEAVFKGADVVALPYTHASQSGVMMMAFGFKKPVVITDAFHDKNWVDHKTGLVAKTKNADDLAAQLAELITDEDLMKRYGENGYKYAMKNYNWENIAGKYYNVFKRTLEAKDSK